MNRLVVLGLAVAVAGCGQGNSDNVMSPESNALSPAQVNAALGPETSGTMDINAAGDDVNAVGAADNNMAYPPDEPGTSNSTE